MKKSILLVSGMDFSGKSTVVRSLKQVIPNAEQREKYVAEAIGNAALQEVFRIKKSPIWGTDWTPKQMHDFDELMYQALKFDAEHYVKSNNPVIQDSLLAIKRYAKLLQRTNNPQNIARYQAIIEQLPEAHSFYLTTEPAERLRRFKLRADKGGEITRTDKILVQDPDTFLQIDEIYKTQVFNKYPDTQILDTTNQSPEEVVDTILRSI